MNWEADMIKEIFPTNFMITGRGKKERFMAENEFPESQGFLYQNFL